MRWMTHNSRLLVVAFALIPAWKSGQPLAFLQTAAGQTATPPTGVTNSAPSAASSAAVPQGVVLDRLVAVVNGDVILESDVDEETAV